MNLTKAENIAREKLNEYGLNRWRIFFTKSVSRFGSCRYDKACIFLSKPLVEMNEEARVVNTIMHEIAHALVGSKHNHDKVWKRKAIEVGCDGKRCYDISTVKRPDTKWIAICGHCGMREERYKRIIQLACGRCCHGHWEKQYVLRWEKK